MDDDGCTKYWVRLGGTSFIPLTKDELWAKYGDQLTAETPCAKVGENQWGQLSDFFPDFQTFEPRSPEASAATAPQVRQPVAEPERYPFLRLVARIYVIFAILAMFAGLAVTVAGIAVPSWPMIFGGMISAVLGAITNLAISEGIKLLLDIEKNTRRKA